MKTTSSETLDEPRQPADRTPDPRLRDVLDSAEVGWWDWDIRSNRVIGSPELARIFGREPAAAARGEPIEAFFANIHPADRLLLKDALDDAIRTGEPLREEYRVLRPDGGVIWALARGRCLRDEHGHPHRFPGVALDITETKRAEERIRDLDLGRELAMQAAGLGRFDHNPSTGERFYDQRALAMLGVTRHQSLTMDGVLQSVVHPEDRDALAHAVDNAVHPERTGPLKHTFRILHGHTGEERWIHAVGRTQFKDGVCTRFMGVFDDVTEARRAEEHRRLLTNELNHRVKNSLAVVQGLVDQSLRNAAGADLATVRDDIGNRIRALSRAHDLLTADNWTAAGVSQIVEGLIGSLTLPRDRLEVAGPPIKLGPSPAMQLSLALHELATNALKYGALSNDTGRVTLNWGVEGLGDETRFCIRWTERGGPTVQPPTRRGFGSVLIERATARAFHGEIQMDFPPAGVRWTLTAPFAGLAESGRAGAEEPPPDAPAI